MTVSIDQDQIIVLDLSRRNICPRFIETKSLSSIYEDQITVDLLKLNDYPQFI